MIVPTVRIKHPEHPDGIVINESDFDEDKHELQYQQVETVEPKRRGRPPKAKPE